jgi:POTRA domain, FtsQ-type/Cell division protein FtsQ/DivIB, C-terminal
LRGHSSFTIMTRQNSTRSRARPRRRRTVGGDASLGGIGPAPIRVVRASRRTLFALYAPRISLRQLGSKVYWHTNRPKFLSAALIVILSVSLYQLFSSDWFYVSRVTLLGNHLLQPAEVEQAAGISGWNVFFVDSQEVEQAIKRLPEVKDASVSVDLPNEVVVQISDRLPQFVWETSGGAYWVDEDGIALRVRFDSPNLLIMKDLDGSAVKIGERVNAEAFNAAVTLRNVWPDGPRTFEWSKAHGLAIHDSHGWLVYFGSASQMADKLAALKIVTAQLEKTQHAIAYIDVGSGLPYYHEAPTKE